MSTTVLKSLAKNTFEIPLVILSVFSAFILLFNFLNYVFPHGSSLRYMVDDGQFLEGDTSNPFRYDPSLQVEYDGKRENLYSEENIAARIKSIKRNVKTKASNKIAWSSARNGLALYSRDAVQTFRNSSAKIQFDEENYINLGENALVIIKKMEDDPILREKVTRLIVFSGELSGKISSSKRNRMRMEIKAPGAKARLTSTNAEEPALIKFKVNPDKTSTVTVIKGEAEITSNDEKKIVKRNEAVTLSSEGPADIASPPPRATPITPRKDALFRFKDIPPTVKFSWRKQEEADRYELLVAKDKQFSDIVMKKHLDRSYIENKTFGEGTYYWRVRSKNGGLDGVFSEVRTFKIEEDNEAPELVVNLPPDSYAKREYTITGAGEPGTVMFINNEPVKIKGNGKFTHTIQFNKGSNTIVIEAIDKAGNVTYKSKIVNVVGVD